MGPVTGTITTKVKGAFFYNGKLTYTDNCEGLFNDSKRVFDAGDFVIPPQVSLFTILRVKDLSCVLFCWDDILEG